MTERAERTIIRVMQKYSVWLFLIASLCPAFVQSMEGQNSDMRKMSPVVQLLVTQPKSELGKFSRFGVQTRAGEEPRIDVFVRTRTSKEEFLKEGYLVNSQIGGIATMQLTVDQLLTLIKRPDVTGIESSFYRPPVLDISTNTTMTTFSGNTAYLGIGSRVVNSYGINGNGVVIGDVDTGIDITHGDFQSPPGNSRILYIWDQTDATGTPPAGYGYGTEYTQATINLQLSLSTVTIVNQKDVSSHGTHVMGIAAGNGQGTGNAQPAGVYVGVAPQADIIMVKTDFADTHIVDGIQYIFSKASALNKPAVVNLSIGGQYGPHDGTDAFESAIDSTIGPGRIVVVAAGNDGGHFIHAENNTSIGISDTTFVNLLSSNSSFDIDLWYNGGDKYSCTIVAPDGTFLSTTTASNISGAIGGGAGYIFNNTYTSPNSDSEIYIDLSSVTSFGSWSMVLSRDSGSTGNGHYDAWLASQIGIFENHTTMRVLVTEPGNVKKAITVGAYCSKNQWTTIDGTTHTIAVSLGDLSPFSGIGPSRDSTFKPEITAPGQVIVSSVSGQSNHSTDEIVADGQHYALSGTSMSTPHVSGTVALLLQQNPTFSYQTIKTLLFNQGVRADYYTGVVPDTTYRWGFGKLTVTGLIPEPTGIENWLNRDFDLEKILP